jgi:hypothetical protein
MSGQLHAAAALPPGKTPPPQVPIGKEAGWATEPVWMTWRREKKLPNFSSVSSSWLVYQNLFWKMVTIYSPPMFFQFSLYVVILSRLQISIIHVKFDLIFSTHVYIPSWHEGISFLCM